MESEISTDFEGYFMTLDPDAREAFAGEAETTVEYIRDHLLSGRRMPRRRLIEALSAALERRNIPISRQELVTFFDSRSSKEAAA